MNTVLIKDWLKFKEIEKEAQDARRAIEDEMTRLADLAIDFEGTKNVLEGEYEVKIVTRHTRKIDADKLQEIAIENGLTEHLHSLFRWKPEINEAAWKSAHSEITQPLLDAITTTPARPSYSIKIKE